MESLENFWFPKLKKKSIIATYRVSPLFQSSRVSRRRAWITNARAHTRVGVGRGSPPFLPPRVSLCHDKRTTQSPSLVPSAAWLMPVTSVAADTATSTCTQQNSRAASWSEHAPEHQSDCRAPRQSQRPDSGIKVPSPTVRCGSWEAQNHVWDHWNDWS